MNKSYVLEHGGKPAFVVVPYEEYKELIKLKDVFLSDEELYVRAISKDEEYFPEKLVNRILANENPIKIYREYRNMTLEQLGKGIGKTKQYISALEKGERQGTLDTLIKISKVLQVDLDMLSSSIS